MVLKKLFFPEAKPEASAWAAPAGLRIYAVGDIHGRLDLLDDLIDRIDRDDASRGPAQTLLVFLGDLIDRGPESRGVVERLRTLRDEGRNVRFLAGNHEEVFLRAVQGDVRATRFLLKIGGRETIMSYGLTEEEYRDSDFDELTALLRERVPEAHVAFLSAFEDMIALGDYVFVHAGVRPGVAMEDQKVTDLRWIRGDFLDSRDALEKMVVHGHSICEDVEVRPNRIGIDTGAYASGKLTALGLEGGERWFLNT